ALGSGAITRPSKERSAAQAEVRQVGRDAVVEGLVDGGDRRLETLERRLAHATARGQVAALAEDRLRQVEDLLHGEAVQAARGANERQGAEACAVAHVDLQAHDLTREHAGARQVVAGRISDAALERAR